MKEPKIAFVVMVIVTILLSACWETSRERQIVDVRPVGDGLTFLGMAGVLIALILVFGRFITESAVVKWKYIPHFMVGLLVVLAIVVVNAALPALIIPISIAIVVLAILAFAWVRSK